MRRVRRWDFAAEEAGERDGDLDAGRALAGGVGILKEGVIKGDHIPLTSVLVPSPMDRFTSDLAVRHGLDFAELVWWTLAKRIVNVLGQHLKWDEDQWREAQDKFLKPNDYKAQIDWTQA